MPRKLDFYGPMLKIERANHHIADLINIFQQFRRDSKNRLRPKRDRDGARGGSLGMSLPRHTATVLGDALHNLRAALDHAYCLLIEANGNTVSPNSIFPFVRTDASLSLADNLRNKKASVQGHVKSGNAPCQEIIDCIFDDIQPYREGNGHDLFGLHELDIMDKHMVLLPTRMVMPIEELKIRNQFGGGIRFADLSMVSNEKDSVFMNFPAGTGLYRENDFKASFEIVFQEGHPFEGDSILTTLKKLERRVSETIGVLRKIGERNAV